MLTENPDYENKSLSQLRTAVLREFSKREAARGIIFTKTRLSAIALSQWVQENPKFNDIGVKAAHVIGGGDQSVVKPMTPVSPQSRLCAESESASHCPQRCCHLNFCSHQTEQREVLNKFRDGDVNLLVATTVAEEGLDIPECNFVIRYGHVTNEISMIQVSIILTPPPTYWRPRRPFTTEYRFFQTQGRGRAEDSTYTVVDVKNSGVAEKELVNEYRKDMMNKAMDKIKTLSEAEYSKRVSGFRAPCGEIRIAHITLIPRVVCFPFFTRSRSFSCRPYCRKGWKTKRRQIKISKRQIQLMSSFAAGAAT